MWALLSPSPSFNNCWGAFRDYWLSQSIARQRQIYYTIREQKRRGEYIKENPLFAIQDCNPKPVNWNGKLGIADKMKEEKMVSAKYHGSYGVYTSFEAVLFEMTDIKPLNYVE